MKILIRLVVLLILAVGVAHAQAMTQTDCTTNNNQTHCTTGPTPYAQGQAMGNSLGTGLAVAIQRHKANAARNHEKKVAAAQFAAMTPEAREYSAGAHCRAEKPGATIKMLDGSKWSCYMGSDNQMYARAK